MRDVRADGRRGDRSTCPSPIVRRGCTIAVGSISRAVGHEAQQQLAFGDDLVVAIRRGLRARERGAPLAKRDFQTQPIARHHLPAELRVVDAALARSTTRSSAGRSCRAIGCGWRFRWGGGAPRWRARRRPRMSATRSWPSASCCSGLVPDSHRDRSDRDRAPRRADVGEGTTIGPHATIGPHVTDRRQLPDRRIGGHRRLDRDRRRHARSIRSRRSV